MLRPELVIQSVSFQVAGTKGWDDVVVRYADNRSDFIQVKHSRVGSTVTFGELVGTDDQGSSLLSGLFAAWKALKIKQGNSSLPCSPIELRVNHQGGLQVECCVHHFLTSSLG